MLNKKNRKFQVLSALAAFFVLALGSGCTGFFVNPTLTTLTVGPTTPTIQLGSTLQMAATGTYDDGSTKALTGNVFWSTSDSTIANVNSTGLVTAVGLGTATITAQSGTVSNSTSVTTSLANIISIAVKPTNSTLRQGGTEQFMATATLADGTTHDISSTATWTLSNTAVGSIDATGFYTAPTAVTSTETTVVIANSGIIFSPSSGSLAATVTVNQ